MINYKDSIKLFGFVGNFSMEDVKKTYRKLCSKFHPDRNPAGNEMMKMVNAAYSKLSEGIDSGWKTEGTEEGSTYASDLDTAINAIIHCTGITIEVCGSFVWVGGNTKTWKSEIKAAGFKYSGKKKMWYKSPKGFVKRSKRNWNMTDIRETFGSDEVATKSRTAVK